MVVISIATDSGRNEKVRQLIKQFAFDNKLTFLNLIDPNAEVAVQYGVRGIPMTFFINQRGKLIAYATGYREWDLPEGLEVIEKMTIEK